MKKIAADRNYRIFRKKANLVLKTAIAASYEEHMKDGYQVSSSSKLDPEIERIDITKDDDGVITLSADIAAIVSRNINKAGPLLSEIAEQLDRALAFETAYYVLDPRLISLINNLEEANEKLFNAGMQANHLRDGTGD